MSHSRLMSTDGLLPCWIATPASRVTVPTSRAATPSSRVATPASRTATPSSTGPTSRTDTSADTNKDGVISTVEGQPAYGGIGTTLSVKGSTAPSAATDVTVAPGGANFTLNRTFTINQATLSAIKSNNAVIVVHGLNPTNAPKASLSAANSLGVTLPEVSKKLALIGTAPALCGKLTARGSCCASVRVPLHG